MSHTTQTHQCVLPETGMGRWGGETFLYGSRPICFYDFLCVYCRLKQSAGGRLKNTGKSELHSQSWRIVEDRLNTITPDNTCRKLSGKRETLIATESERCDYETMLSVKFLPPTSFPSSPQLVGEETQAV